MSKVDLAKCPAISEMLGRVYESNPRRAIDDLRFSVDPIAIRFLETFDAIPARDRLSVSIEAVCVKAQISPQEFLGHVFLMRQSLSKAESSLVAVSEFPSVVRSMVTSAALPGMAGAADRKMLAQSAVVGFLPAPKGMTMKVSLFGGEASFSSGEDEDGEDEDNPEWAGFDEAFSGGNKELEKWNENRRLLLEAKK